MLCSGCDCIYLSSVQYFFLSFIFFCQFRVRICTWRKRSVRQLIEECEETRSLFAVHKGKSHLFFNFPIFFCFSLLAVSVWPFQSVQTLLDCTWRAPAKEKLAAIYDAEKARLEDEKHIKRVLFTELDNKNILKTTSWIFIARAEISLPCSTKL